MPITRRALVKCLAATAATTAAPVPLVFAQSAEFSYKYAHNVSPAHPAYNRIAQAANAVREETGGRMEIQVFPSNQLGSDTDTLSQLRAGGVQFFNLSGLILATMIPQVSISAIAFAFHDYDTVWRAMDGELGAYIRSQIAKVGLIGMDKPFDNGFRQMTSSTHPIRTPQDLRGFKMRVPVSPLSTAIFRSFGAAPVGINAMELYTALQTGLVDGQENPLSAIAAQKWYEVQKYCAITNHMWDGFWCLGNRRAWDRLPADLRDIVAKHVNQAAILERADLAAQNETLQKQLESAGLTFNATRSDDFRAVLNQSGFYAEWKEKMGADAWTALERGTGVTFG